MVQLGDQISAFRRDFELAYHRHVPLQAAADVDVVGSGWHPHRTVARGGEHAMVGGDGQVTLGFADVIVGELGVVGALDPDEGQLARDGRAGVGIAHLPGEQALIVAGRTRLRGRGRRLTTGAGSEKRGC